MNEDPKIHEHAAIGELSKTQVLLLALFVAFVTSIASSIVTVTLLDQAPPTITQTINRVVEKTIQVAVPGKPIIERIHDAPVVSSDEETIASAAASALPSVVSIFSAANDPVITKKVTTDLSGTVTTTPLVSVTPPSPPLGLGFLASKDGLVVTSSSFALVPKSTYILVGLGKQPRRWEATVLDGVHLPGFTLLNITPAKKETLPSLAFVGDVPRLGKTILALGSSRGLAAVVVGTISSYAEGGGEGVSELRTTVVSGRESIGGPLVDTRGRVVGMIGAEGETLSIDPILHYLEERSVATSTVGIDKKTPN